MMFDALLTARKFICCSRYSPEERERAEYVIHDIDGAIEEVKKEYANVK